MGRLTKFSFPADDGSRAPVQKHSVGIHGLRGNPSPSLYHLLSSLNGLQYTISGHTSRRDRLGANIARKTTVDPSWPDVMKATCASRYPLNQRITCLVFHWNQPYINIKKPYVHDKNPCQVVDDGDPRPGLGPLGHSDNLPAVVQCASVHGLLPRLREGTLPGGRLGDPEEFPKSKMRDKLKKRLRDG